MHAATQKKLVRSFLKSVQCFHLLSFKRTYVVGTTYPNTDNDERATLETRRKMTRRPCGHSHPRDI